MQESNKGREIRIIRRGEERPPQTVTEQISVGATISDRLHALRRPLSQEEARATWAQLFKE